MDPENFSPEISPQTPEQAQPEKPAKKTSTRTKARVSGAAKGRKPGRRATTAKAAEAEETTAPKKTPLRRSMRRKAPVKIPPMLLEDDLTPAQVHKAAAETPQPKVIHPSQPAGVRAGWLPQIEPEGTKEIIAVARDPRSLYVHWDLSARQRREYLALSAEGHLMLRVYAGSLDAPLVTQVKLPAHAYHCFVDVPVGGARYQAELGYNDKAGCWVRISASSVVATPPEQGVASEPIKFATVPLERPLPELVGLTKKAGLEQLPLVEAVEQLRAKGVIQGRGGVEVASGAVASAPELSQAPEMNPAAPAGQFGSEAAQQIMPRQVELGISSPAGVEKAGRPFWFNVNAELVIYGATEPDAQVTLGGLPVKLRPDGTFSYRIALPDGQHELTAEAVSPDKKETRTAQFNFTRTTKYTAESKVKQDS